MEKINNTISIFGSCVSRDIFGMHEGDGGYKIDRFIQANSPVSAVSEKLLPFEIKPDDSRISELLAGMKEFIKKMLLLDLNRNAFSYLSEKKSDYFMLDATSCRHAVLELENNGKIDYITNTDIDKILAILSKLGGPVQEDINKIIFARIPEKEFDDRMGIFLERLLQLYDEEHIILNECYPVLFEMNHNRVSAFRYDLIARANEAIGRGYEFFRKHLPHAHVIEFPQGMPGNHNHKWGPYYLHYIPEYYDYGLKAVDIITQANYTPDQEKQKLRELKNAYEICIREKYMPIVSQYLIRLSERGSEKGSSRSELYDHPYLVNYVKGRLDFKHFGADENDLEILEVSDPKASVQKPLWFCKNGAGYVIQSDRGSLKIRLQCKGNGELRIYLRGVDVRNKDGDRIPIKIDFTEMSVNGTMLFTDTHCVWHDKPYYYQMDTKNGEIVLISAAWTVHDDRT